MRSMLAIIALAAFAIYMVQSEPAPKNVITCTICTDLVQIVDEAITDNNTISQIESALFSACDILVGIEQDCKDFVHENLQMVIDLLVNEYLKPSEVCESLSLCP